MVIAQAASRPARAETVPLQSPAETFAARVEVEGDLTCTDEAEFWKRIALRTSELRPARKGEAAPSFVVRIVDSAEGSVGELRSRTLAGSELPVRTIDGASCDEVASALALMVVLATEEERLSAKRAPSHGGHDRPPIADEPRRKSPWSVAAGAHLAVAALDEPTLGGGVFGELRFSGALHPILRWEAMGFRHVVTLDAGTAAMTWALGRAQLCLLEFTHARRFSLRPCAFLDGGVLRASAVRADEPRSFNGFWLAPGVLAQMEWRMNRWLSLELQGGGAAPLIHSELVFLNPRTPVYRTPSWTWQATLGPVAHFP